MAAAPPPVPLLEYPRWLRSQGPGSGSGGPPPDPMDQWITELRAVFSTPEDRQFLEDMIARGVTVTVFDEISFDDFVYENGSWRIEVFPAAGSTSSQHIDMIRTGDAVEDATTLFHEGVHTRQPDAMSQREAEFEAYIAEEHWAIAHGLPASDPSFRTIDADGNVVVNEQAIRDMVDEITPGVTIPTTGGPAEQIIGLDPDGKVRIRCEDGSEYSREPEEGDSYPGDQRTEPPGGITIDLRRLL